MKAFTKLMLLAGLVAMFQMGCGDDEDKVVNPLDGGVNNNNTGTDTNQTTGTDDTDTNAVQQPTGPCELISVTNEDNFFGTETNSCGAQGSWYTYADTDVIEGFPNSTIEIYRNDAGAVCARGTAAMADDNWKIWGAGMGMNLCDQFPISACATSAKLATMVGFKVKVTGTLGELRVTMGEALDTSGGEDGRAENTFITASQADADAGNSVCYLFADASVEYSTTAPPIDTTLVRALQFQSSSNQSSDTPFDFCVEEVTVLFQEDIDAGVCGAVEEAAAK